MEKEIIGTYYEIESSIENLLPSGIVLFVRKIENGKKEQLTPDQIIEKLKNGFKWEEYIKLKQEINGKGPE